MSGAEQKPNPPMSDGDLLRRAATNLEDAARYYRAALEAQGRAVTLLNRASTELLAAGPVNMDPEPWRSLANAVEGAELLQVDSDAGAQEGMGRQTADLEEVARQARRAADTLDKAAGVLQ